MRRYILVLGLAVLLLFLTACIGENAIVGSAVRTKEVKEYELESCIVACNEIVDEDVENCIDGCFFTVSDSYNDKALCLNIKDENLKESCLSS